MNIHSADIFEPTGASEELINQVDESVDEIDSHRPLDDELVDKLEREILYDRVHSSAVTEGNNLNRRETIVVLTKGVVEAGSRKDELEVRNLADAILLLREYINENSRIREDQVRQLHQKLLKDVDDGIAGKYRDKEVTIAGAPSQPPSFYDVPKLMNEVLESESLWNSKYHPVQRACWIHWAIARIHPFVDGNGRVARLLQDYILLRENYVPSVLRAEDRDGSYYEALEAADEGNGKKLLEMVSKNIIHISNRYLSIIRDASEKENWLDSVTEAATEKVRQTEHRQFLVYSKAMNLLKAEFSNIASELNDRIPELYINFKEYGGIDMDKYLKLKKKGHAKRTWFFGVEFNISDTTLRYIFWYGKHRERPDDITVDFPSDVTLLVSEEEESRHYRKLDDLEEDRVTLREVFVDRPDYWRRRYNPVDEKAEWDTEVSAGTIARDFFQEVLGKLGLV